jgi:hypothetical protein
MQETRSAARSLNEYRVSRYSGWAVDPGAGQAGGWLAADALLAAPAGAVTAAPVKAAIRLAAQTIPVPKRLGVLGSTVPPACRQGERIQATQGRPDTGASGVSIRS